MKNINPKVSYIFLVIFSSLAAIVFTILFILKAIKFLDLFLTITYIAYLVGIALIYTGAYTKTKGLKIATICNFTVGSACVVASIVMLIYGLSIGTISLF